MPHTPSRRPAVNAFVSIPARPFKVMAAAAVRLLLFAVCGCLTASAQTTSFVELASVNAAGTQVANSPSTKPRSSEDGRYVVFESNANNLVTNDTNGFVIDVFVRDVQLDTTRLVSVNAAGNGSGDGHSSGASITPDGRYVVFQSTADDLLAGTVLNGLHVYVRDLVAQTTTLVSFDASGVPFKNPAYEASITPDGRYVVFRHGNEVYRRDLSAGTTVLASADAGGGEGLCTDARVTPDGRYVIFKRVTGSLFAGTLRTNIYRRDTQTNTTAIASVNYAGTGGGNDQSGEAVISDDGQVVAFTSSSTDLLGPDTPVKRTISVYARNFADNTTTLVSEPQVFQGTTPTIPPSSLPRFTADGRYVFYLRIETAGDELNRAGFRDRVFRRDRQTGALLELPFVPTSVCDQDPNCFSTIREYVISSDGRYVAYRQYEQPRSNFTPFSYSIVVRDMLSGGADIIKGFSGTPSNPSDQYPKIFSLGSVVAGGKVAFSSGMSHSPLDTNISEDVYLFAPAEQTRLSFNRANYNVGEDGSRLSTHVIVVRREGNSVDTAATVKLKTADGTATAGSDYVPLSETLTFAAGETEKTVTVQIINDDVLEPAETLNLTLSDPTGNAALGNQSSATLTIGDNDLHTVQFGADAPFGAYAFEAGDGTANIAVTRTGATTQTVSVDYATSDGTASERTDYITATGRITFAPGETTKYIRVFIVDDAHVESDETFTVTLSNLRGANAVLGAATKQMTIFSEDATTSAANPIDDTEFFVLQHYLDFLNRRPDEDGFLFWTNEIEQCGADAQCREVKRINVSAAFFLSIEFQQTGYLAYRARKAAFGNLAGKPVPVTRNEMLLDMQMLGSELVVGANGWEDKLEQNKRAYFNQLAASDRFAAAYPQSMTPEQYVGALNSNADGALSPAEIDALVAGLKDGTKTRAQALRAVAEDADLNSAEKSKAFVLMQYFGYLRRNPNDAPEPGLNFNGYNFWLGKLDEFNGNFIQAEMVKAFITADEYRKRFGR